MLIYATGKKMGKHRFELTTLFNLYRTNSKLTKRVRKNEYYYLIFIALGSFWLMIFWGAILFTDIIRFDNGAQQELAFSATIFFVFTFDFFFMLLRFQNGSLIELYHLSIFPIAKNLKLRFNLLLMLIDRKSIIYLPIILLLAASFFKDFFLLRAFIGVALIFELFLTMNIWAFVFYNIFGESLTKIRKNVLVLFYFWVISFNVMLITKRLDLLGSLPIISNAGLALYALKAGDLTSVLINGLLIGIFLFAGILAIGLLALERNYVFTKKKFYLRCL